MIAGGFVAVAVVLQACERLPEFVYILEAPQIVELGASASAASIAVGEPVILHAQRKTRGSWRRIPSRDLQPGQCWMAALPPEHEAAVSDNLHWRVEPDGAATFNTDFRSDRTRTVVLSQPGVFMLTPSSTVWCEPGRTVVTAPVRIEVHAK